MVKCKIMEMVHLILYTAKLKQHTHFKGIMTSEIGTKDMLLWKRDSSFVSTEDENLWIASRLIWLERP